MSQTIFSQVNLAENGNLPLLSHCSVNEILNCVKKSCFTLTESQLDILLLFKNTLLNLRSEVETCVNILIGHELQITSQKINALHTEELAINKKEASARVTKFSSRENNIVIHGMDHVDLLDTQRRTEFISTFLRNTLKANVKIKSIQVKSARKAGHFVVIVELESKEDKRKVFRNCHLLKNYCKKVSVTDDLTINERRTRRTSQESQSEKEIKLEEATSKPNTEAKTVEKLSFAGVEGEPANKVKKKGELFWNSKDILAKHEDLTQLGKNHGFEKEQIETIAAMHAYYIRDLLEECDCACRNFCNIEWTKLSDEVGYSLSKKFVKKYKIIINGIQNAWNANGFEECFCHHVASCMDEDIADADN